MRDTEKVKIMRENKNGVWGKFRDAWPYHCERIEPTFDSGLPDVLLKDIRGNAGFVELKAPDKLELRPSQEAWIGRWQYEGSCAIPIVTCDNHGGKIQWKIFRFPLMGPRWNRKLKIIPAISKTGGKWMPKEEMIHLVCIMNGLEPYLE